MMTCSNKLWSFSLTAHCHIWARHNTKPYYLTHFFLSFYAPSVASVVTFAGVIYPLMSCKSAAANSWCCFCLYIFQDFSVSYTLINRNSHISPILDLLYSIFPDRMFIFAMVHDCSENKFISIKHISDVMSIIQWYYRFKHSFQVCVIVHAVITWFYCTCSGITPS